MLKRGTPVRPEPQTVTQLFNGGLSASDPTVFMLMDRNIAVQRPESQTVMQLSASCRVWDRQAPVKPDAHTLHPQTSNPRPEFQSVTQLFNGGLSASDPTVVMLMGPS